MAQLSGANSKYRCQICEFVSTIKSAVTAHVETCHNQASKSSTENGIKELKEHQRTEHEGVNFKSRNSCKNVILNCSRCNFKTRNGNQHLKDHEKTVHEGVFFKCDICGKSAARKKSIIEHKKRMHQGIKRFKCARCEYANFEKKHVLHHITERHPEMDDETNVEALIIKIPEPEYMYKGEEIKTYYRTDMTQLSGANSQYKCQICEFVSTTKTKVTAHVETCHNQSDIRENINEDFKTCEECGSNFQNKSQLSQHIKRVHKKKIQRPRSEETKLFSEEAMEILRSSIGK